MLSWLKKIFGNDRKEVGKMSFEVQLKDIDFANLTNIETPFSKFYFGLAPGRGGEQSAHFFYGDADVQFVFTASQEFKSEEVSIISVHMSLVSPVFTVDDPDTKAIFTSVEKNLAWLFEERMFMSYKKAKDKNKYPAIVVFN